MRKRIIRQNEEQAPAADVELWLELDRLAQVELTSEDPQHPIESALTGDDGSGWRAQQPGEQRIRLVFDQPRQIRRVRLLIQELEQPRTQEFVLRWSADRGMSWLEIVRQHYTFSPPATTAEREDYTVDLNGLTTLELCLVPDISGGQAIASLAQLRVA